MELDVRFWSTFLLIGVAGLGIGLGLVLGAFAARNLRRYMRDEGLNGVSEKPPKRDRS